MATEKFQGFVCQIAMISVNMEFLATKKHGAKLFEGFHNGEKFLSHGGVVLLSSIEILGIESNMVNIFHDHSSKVEITGISVNMKRLVMVRIS